MQVPSLGWEDPLKNEMAPTPVFLPGESHGQKSLVGYSPWGHEESDTTEQLNLRRHQLQNEYFLNERHCSSSQAFLPSVSGFCHRNPAHLHRPGWAPLTHVQVLLCKLAPQEKKTQKSSMPQKISVILWLVSMHLLLKK